MTNSDRIDRRQLVQGMAMASAVFAFESIASPQAVAADKAEDEKAKPPELPAEELLLLNYIMQRYRSTQYDEAAIRGILGDLRGDIARGRMLSEFPLKNSDAPCLQFRAYRSPE